jgi:tetratricopeptide (TPR) repeat protein
LTIVALSALVLAVVQLLSNRPGASATVRILYPPDHAMFPPEIAPPEFAWEEAEPAVRAWLVTVAFADEGPAVTAKTEKCRWTPTDAEWQEIVRHRGQGEARVLVCGLRDATKDTVASRGQIAIGISKDEVGAPLFYREVNLPFADAVRDPSRIQWRFGPVSSKERPRLVLTHLPVCGNCHSFSADGSLLGMDVDYANDKGSYALARVEEQTVLDPGKVLTWSDYKRDDKEPTFGLLSQVSPDGNYVVSTVKDRSVFVAKPENEFSQLFFPIKGILAVYSRRTKTFSALPGADDPEYVQSNPAWSPDGKRIFFARAKAYSLAALHDREKVLLTEDECREFLHGSKTFRFDLCSVPFNEGRGGRAEPLPGASGNGMSNFFPKCSPDGKWIVFCKAKSFMLLQPDSELYILPAAGGEARRLRCNTGRMNSWHSWSPNGKWLVFSSKARGPYTQLCLTHIDEEGNSTPAWFSTGSPAPIAPRTFRSSSTWPPPRPSRENHFYLGKMWQAVGRTTEAVAQYREALKLDPGHEKAGLQLALLLPGLGRTADAVRLYRQMLQRKPDQLQSLCNLARLLATARDPACRDAGDADAGHSPGRIARATAGHCVDASASGAIRAASAVARINVSGTRSVPDTIATPRGRPATFKRKR